jgi:hypothetical protein
MGRMMQSVAAVCVWLVMLASPAVAQVNTALLTGVNVDIDAVTAPGAGQPTILFGGALGQSGYWNPIRNFSGFSSTFTLRNLANSADVLSMQITRAEPATLVLGDTGPATGDAGLLINDYLDIGQPVAGTTTVHLFDLPVGIYDLAVYAVDPSRATERTNVSVRSPTAEFGEIQIAGPVPASGALIDQVTHRRLRFAHPRTNTLSIELRGATSDGIPRFGTFNGLQIKKLTPTRLYVTEFGAGDRTGLDWASALGNLRTALEIARVTPSITEIWVAQGTYNANTFLTVSTDRNEAFVIRGGLSIYGGFAGTENTIAQRSGTLVTRLSGVNRQYHTVVIDGQSNILLDGLTIADGFNDLDFLVMGPFSGGAGLFVENGASNIIARSCRFVNNSAPSGASGAIGVAFNASLQLEDCQIYGNQALFSSALELSNGGSVTMMRCAITNNIGGGGSGGVLGGFLGGTFTLDNCLIANNTAELNVMDFSTMNGRVTIRQSTIANNRNPVSNQVGLALPEDRVVVNCLIAGNAGPSGATGPGAPTMTQLFVGGGDGGEIFDNSIQGYGGEFGSESGTGNNAAEARFVNPLAAGAPGGTAPVAIARYELASRSPARDSGFNGHVPLLSVDLKKAPRFVDDAFMPNRGFSGGWIDRGCLEAQAPSDICPGDVAGEGASEGADGVRDNNDFIVFISWFFAMDPRGDVGTEGGGVGSDGAFDNNDLVVFIGSFFEACP